MADYAELIKALRCCSKIDARNNGCDSCPYEYCGDDCQNLCGYAADAIEELLAKVRSVVHCKDCEWWTKQEASIQGRCARLAIYPTGEFYCASGSKAEPPEEENAHD